MNRTKGAGRQPLLYWAMTFLLALCAKKSVKIRQEKPR